MMTMVMMSMVIPTAGAAQHQVLPKHSVNMNHEFDTYSHSDYKTVLGDKHFISLQKRGERGTKTLSYLLKITQLISNRPGL